MKLYPAVYYTLNELADLSGYDRKGFKDRLIRMCEMYSIPIEEFKIHTDEKDSGYLFTPNVAELVLILVKPKVPSFYTKDYVGTGTSISS